MFLPQTINVLNQTIPIVTVFVVAAVFYYFFVVWYEGKKDGFDTEKLLDLYSLSAAFGLLAGVALWRYLVYAQIYVYDSPLLFFDTYLLSVFVGYLGVLLSAILISRRRHWSVFRILDNLLLGLSTSLGVLAVGKVLTSNMWQVLIYVLLITLINRFLIKFKGYKIPSGWTFVALNVYLALSLVFLYPLKGDLIVSGMLVTMSGVLFYFRYRVGNMKTTLPLELLEHLKNKLINKDNELKKQEKNLNSEDPYLQEGRAFENSENIDEVMLEDAPKALVDAKRDIITKVRAQIRRALGYMKIGRYGICEVCGKPIDKARLSFYPEATKCASCASKVE